MREIKFRAWDKEKNIMYYNETPDKDAIFVDTLGAINCWLNSNDTYLFMQYTGLKDKKGKEIYEGDIVAHNEEVMSDNGEDLPNYIDKRIDLNFRYGDGSIGERRWGKKIEVVIWEESSCGFEPFSDSQSNCGHCGGGISPNQIEVIGNIYENPELLEG